MSPDAPDDVLVMPRHLILEVADLTSLGALFKLYEAADNTWPRPAAVPRWIDPEILAALAESGHVTLHEGDRYTVPTVEWNRQRQHRWQVAGGRARAATAARQGGRFTSSGQHSPAPAGEKPADGDGDGDGDEEYVPSNGREHGSATSTSAPVSDGDLTSFQRTTNGSWRPGPTPEASDLWRSRYGHAPSKARQRILDDVASDHPDRVMAWLADTDSMSEKDAIAHLIARRDYARRSGDPPAPVRTDPWAQHNRQYYGQAHPDDPSW